MQFVLAKNWFLSWKTSPSAEKEVSIHSPPLLLTALGKMSQSCCCWARFTPLSASPGCSVNFSYPHANSQFSKSLLKLESGHSTWFLTTLSKTIMTKTGPEREVTLREQHGRHFADLGFGSGAEFLFSSEGQTRSMLSSSNHTHSHLRCLHCKTQWTLQSEF